MTSPIRRCLLGAALALSATGAQASDFADEAFLEFLGSFDDGEGNWLDPTELVQIEAADEAARLNAPRRVRDNQDERDDEDKMESDDDDATDND